MWLRIPGDTGELSLTDMSFPDSCIQCLQYQVIQLSKVLSHDSYSYWI